jgi:hypothetical protein
MDALLTREQVVKQLKKLVAESTVEDLALDFGLKSRNNIYDVIAGRKAPTKKILAGMKLRKETVTRYRRIA